MDCDTQSDPSVTAPPRYLVKAGRQRLGISTEFSMGPELEVFDVRSMMEKCGGGVPLEACNQHIPWRLELWQKCTNKLMTFTLWGFGSWGWGCGNRLARFVSWQWEPDKIRRMFVWLVLLSKPWRQSSVLGLNSVLTHTH